MRRVLLILLLTAFFLLGPNVKARSEPQIFEFELAGVNDTYLTATGLFRYDVQPADPTQTHPEDLGTATIDIWIMNTSSLAAGPDPRLTGFAFNLPTPPENGDAHVSFYATGATCLTDLSRWRQVFKPNRINTPGRFGFFDIAAITGPNFNGGKPNAGIPANCEFSFRFVLTGWTLGSLQGYSFPDEYSDEPVGRSDEDSQFFIGRFQRTGLDGEGSDVAIPVELPPETPEEPEVL
jgi:hypothetical protein